MTTADESVRKGSLKVWFFETRPQFLLLSLVLVFLGTAMAWYEGFFSPLYFVLGLVGLLLLHISVNTLNDYFDYKSGIDLETRRTPFSGGSGVLTAHLLTPESVYKFAIACFVLAVPIGIYFVLLRGWLLLPLFVIGAVCVLFYTTYLAKWRVGEFFAGLGLGTLPVLGLFVIQSGTYTWAAVFASIPSGILTHNLLFLNEFPDVEADRKAGRKHLPIVLGKQKAAKLYGVLTIAMYIWIAAGVASRLMPLPTLLGLLTIPLALKAIKGAQHYEEENKLLPALGSNVMLILGTQALMALGYIVAKLL